MDGAITAAAEAARDGLWAAGFVSYEAAPGLDPALTVRPASPTEEAPPLVWFGVFERRRKVRPLEVGSGGAPEPELAWRRDADVTSYRERVRRIQGHVGAGDTYQLNLTYHWRSPGPADGARLYRRLALAQRPGFGALIDTGRWTVASASPELFFHWRDGIVTCRPMKGTATRGRWPLEDRAAGMRLAASAKDRAENVMIVDLVRNDMGRFADYGTVAVTDLLRLERYPAVWQLTSEVSARARRGTTLLDVFRALFPSGSVTGAPKARTMQLIVEVEDRPRGVYCGAVGFVNLEEARFNVAIRTAVIDGATGAAEFGTGGGIVWDSRPEMEDAEATAKAAILRTEPTAFELIETMAFVPGEGLRNRDRHLDRLAASADYFGFRWQRRQLEALLDRTVAHLTAPVRLRLTLSPSGRACLETSPLPDRAGRVPVHLDIDDQPVSSADISLFHKTTRRRPYTDRLARHPRADDVILVNERGEVTETAIANLAVLRDGRWVTPPLDSGCLPGIARGRLLDEGRLVERPITVDELRAAPEVAVVSSVRGWCPAVVRPERPKV